MTQNEESRPAPAGSVERAKLAKVSVVKRQFDARKGKIDKSYLEGILARPDIDVGFDAGKLTFRVHGKPEPLDFVLKGRKIWLIDSRGRRIGLKKSVKKRTTPTVRRAIGRDPLNADMPAMSGLKVSPPVPRVVQPLGTEPSPPKIEPAKRWPWHK